MRDAALNAATAFVDSGTGAATLKIYTGTQPAAPTDAPTGTLLMSFTLNKPSYLPSMDGSAGMDTGGGISTVALASGVAGWGRLATSDGTAAYDGSCGTGSTAEFTLSALSITAGQVVVLTAGTLSVPSGA